MCIYKDYFFILKIHNHLSFSDIDYLQYPVLFGISSIKPYKHLHPLLLLPQGTGYSLISQWQYEKMQFGTAHDMTGQCELWCLTQFFAALNNNNKKKFPPSTWRLILINRGDARRAVLRWSSAAESSAHIPGREHHRLHQRRDENPKQLPDLQVRSLNRVFYLGCDSITRHWEKEREKH